MGYTHYWDNTNKAISKKKKVQFVALFDAMMQISPDTVEVNKLTDDVLWFNGIEARDEDHETMTVTFDGGGDWQFCKTARKPYDKFVVASLILAEELGIIKGWSSDGDDEPDYDKAGRDLLQHAKENLAMEVDS